MGCLYLATSISHYQGQNLIETSLDIDTHYCYGQMPAFKAMDLFCEYLTQTALLGNWQSDSFSLIFKCISTLMTSISSSDSGGAYCIALVLRVAFKHSMHTFVDYTEQC